MVSKKGFSFSILSLIILFGVLGFASAETLTVGEGWTENENPVFDPDAKAYYPSVVKISDTDYRMWYSDGDDILLATSNNGIDWEDQDVVLGTSITEHHPNVIYDENGFGGTDYKYKMWYWNGNNINYAYSADGENWINYENNPVLSKTTNPELWSAIYDLKVYYDDGLYEGWIDSNGHIYYSTSSNGINWNTAIEVLEQGTDEDWDLDHSRVSVIEENGVYHMWYGSGTMEGESETTYGIGHATATEIGEFSFTKDADNPILHRTDGVEWRSVRTYTPMVIKDGSVYKMWFTGKDNSGNYAIGYAITKSLDTYSTIQSAIFAASEGDTIEVAEGTYFGGTINKNNLKIIAKEGDEVIINDGPIHSSGYLRSGFYLPEDYSGDGALISGFKFEGVQQNDKTDDGYLDLAIFSRGANNVIVENNIFSNTLQAISNWGGSYWNITNNQINGLWTLGGGGIGIIVASRNGNTVTDNIISDNMINGTLFVWDSDGGEYDGTGIVLYTDFRWSNTGGVVSNNKILNNKISLVSNNPSVVNANGIELTDTREDNSEISVTNNEVSGNEVMGNSGDGIAISSGTEGTILNFNKIMNNEEYELTYNGVDFLNAQQNYWGTNDGEEIETLVSGDVDYSNWITQGEEEVETTGTPVVLEIPDTDVTLNLTTTQTGTITVQQYSEDSHGGFSASDLGKFISIESTISNDDISQAEIRIYYTDDDLVDAQVVESSLKMYYYNENSGDWEVVEDSGVNTEENYVWAITEHFSDYGVGGDGDGEGPIITNVFINPNYPNLISKLIMIYATITDPSGIADYPELKWRILQDGVLVGEYDIPQMDSEGDDLYSGGIYIDKPKDNMSITYKIVAYDNLGNMNQTHTQFQYLFTFDGSEPITSDDASPDWTNESVDVTISCLDLISGCNKTYYSINDVDQGEFTAPTTFTLSETGQYQLKYYSTDNASNSESVKTGTLVKIDKIIPTSSDDYNYNDVWMNANQTITLSEIYPDGLSPVTIKYCLTQDCTPDIDYTEAIIISDEGTNYLRYQSVDEAGNVEETINEKIVKIDKSIPSTSHDAPTGWQNSIFDVTLTETTNDGFSDVTTYYKIWNTTEEPTNWTTGNTILVNSDGEYNIKYYSTDEAGNIETEKTNSVQLDKTTPVVTINNVTTPTNNVTQTITGTFTETNINLITVNGVNATVNGNNYSATISLTEGNHSVNVIATDEASNSASISRWIVLDTANPTIAITLPATNGTEIDLMDYYLVQADADDSSSGIKNVKITLRDSEEDVVGNLENTIMNNGTYGYEYMMNLWQLESGDYSLVINATDEAGNYAYDVRTFVIQDNVAPSVIKTISGTVSAETGGTVTFRFNVTARGEDGIKFGMGNVGAYTPSALNARISEDGITFAEVGGFDGTNIVNAETLNLMDLDSETENIQGSFVLYLDVPANMTPGTYPITYYIDN